MLQLTDRATSALFNTAKHASRLAARTVKDNEPVDIEVPASSAVIFILTFVFMGFALAAISYTYGHLITTLCMVESAGATSYVPISTVEPAADAPPAYEDDEASPAGVPKNVNGRVVGEEGLVHTRPVTSSIRGTIAHLRARAGFMSRFRGLGIYLVWNMARSFLVGLLSTRASNPFTLIIAAVIAEVALANVHLTWIHVIISEPSPFKWFSRLPRPALRAWKKIAPAVAIWAVSSQITTVAPMLLTGTFGPLRHMSDPNYNVGRKEAYATAGQLFFMFCLTIFLFVGLQIPATVAMVRVAASMLPEECETIVPFDRTFGGMTTPEIVGGQGKIGIVQAWKTFNGEQRRRLLSTVLKVVGILLAVEMLFGVILGVEMHLLFTKEQLGQMLKGIHGVTKGPA